MAERNVRKSERSKSRQKANTFPKEREGNMERNNKPLTLQRFGLLAKKVKHDTFTRFIMPPFVIDASDDRIDIACHCGFSKKTDKPTTTQDVIDVLNSILTLEFTQNSQTDNETQKDEDTEQSQSTTN